MNIKVNKKDVELNFGFKFLREIDDKLGLKFDEATIGQGVSLLPIGLESGNPVVVGEVLMAATSHLKKDAITLKQIDDVLDELAETEGLEEFGSQVLKELGKRPMTRNLVEKVEDNKAETQETEE
ncbi:tail assembly chaperone [Staphylococcus xylosus]